MIMKLRTLALTAAIGLTAVAATQAQAVSGSTLKLRGTNTTAASIGTVTVPALTLPRTYTFQDLDGTIALTTGTLSANRFVYTDASGLITATGALSNGQILIGSGVGAPSAATLGVARGLTVTNGAGTISLGMPTAATTSSVLRFDGTDWVETGAPFTVDATGNVSSQGDATLGAPLSATGGSLILHDNAAGSSFTGTIQAPAFTANRTIDLPDASGTIIVGSGGTLNRLVRFGAGNSIVDASLSDDGAGTLARAGDINLNPGVGNSLITNGNGVVRGDITIGAPLTTAGGSLIVNDENAVSTEVGTIVAPVFTANRTINIPDADGTILLSTGGTANRLTRWGAGGTSIVNGSLSDDGTGTLSGTTVVTMTTTSTEMVFEQTGDALGDSRIRLQNRTGSNGALFEQIPTVAGVDLIDLGFKPGAGVQSNIRLEARAAQLADGANAPNGEFQFFMNSTGVATRALSVGSASVVVNTGGAVDLTVAETGFTRAAANIAINPGAANTVTTNGSLQVDGNTTLGNADADITTARGTINLNTTNTAGATVNINTSAQANTTNIGSSTAGNSTNITGNAAGAALTLVNANGAAGIGLSITDAFTTGLSIGTTTPPVTGIVLNSTATGITVNTGGGNDLTINQDALTRNGNIAVNPGSGNTLSTDGNTTLGSLATNTTTINGIVRGAGANRFANRVDIAALDADGLITIANTAVAAGAVIIVTVESPAADATVYTMKVQNVVAATSFDVQFAGGALAAAAGRFLNYIIINP